MYVRNSSKVSNAHTEAQCGEKHISRIFMKAGLPWGRARELWLSVPGYFNSLSLAKRVLSQAAHTELRGST